MSLVQRRSHYLSPRTKGDIAPGAVAKPQPYYRKDPFVRGVRAPFYKKLKLPEEPDIFLRASITGGSFHQD